MVLRVPSPGPTNYEPLDRRHRLSYQGRRKVPPASSPCICNRRSEKLLSAFWGSSGPEKRPDRKVRRERRRDAGTRRRSFSLGTISIGRVAQWESACFTRKRSEVQNLPRPPPKGPGHGHFTFTSIRRVQIAGTPDLNDPTFTELGRVGIVTPSTASYDDRPKILFLTDAGRLAQAQTPAATREVIRPNESDIRGQHRLPAPTHGESPLRFGKARQCVPNPGTGEAAS
jgi:hypothetical protein